MVEGKRCQIRSHDAALAPLRKRQIDTQLKSSQGESGFTLITVKSHNIFHPNKYNIIQKCTCTKTVNLQKPIWLKMSLKVYKGFHVNCNFTANFSILLVYSSRSLKNKLFCWKRILPVLFAIFSAHFPSLLSDHHRCFFTNLTCVSLCDSCLLSVVVFCIHFFCDGMEDIVFHTSFSHFLSTFLSCSSFYFFVFQEISQIKRASEVANQVRQKSNQREKNRARNPLLF